MKESQFSQSLLTAQNYEKNIVAYTMRPLATFMLGLVNPKPGENVLDVACGTGVMTRQTVPFLGRKGKIVGIDTNLAMLSVADSFPAPEAITVTWCGGDAHALPLVDETFESVFCQHGVQYFLNPMVALREMHRVLRAGGHIAVSAWRSLVYNPATKLIWEAIAHNLNTTVEILLPAFRLTDAGELSALLEAAGFVDVSVVDRSYTVRQPRNPKLIMQLLASVENLVPAYAAIGAEKKVKLAQTIENEIGPILENYVDGNEQLYPMSANIALARKI